MYGLTLLGIRVTGFALDEYARREHLYSAAPASDEAEQERRTILPVVGAYSVALLVGLVLPTVAVVAYCVLGIYLVVPFRDVMRLFRH